MVIEMKLIFVDFISVLMLANHSRLNKAQRDFMLTLALLNKLMPHSLLIFSQSDYLIWIVAINSHT